LRAGARRGVVVVFVAIVFAAAAFAAAAFAAVVSVRVVVGVAGARGVVLGVPGRGVVVRGVAALPVAGVLAAGAFATAVFATAVFAVGVFAAAPVAAGVAAGVAAVVRVARARGAGFVAPSASAAGVVDFGTLAVRGEREAGGTPGSGSTNKPYQARETFPALVSRNDNNPVDALCLHRRSL
jgi:hypothetical protein